MDRLRSPGGCPWDAEQTHASLARYLLEETHEVLEALDTGDRVLLREELGDLLLQVVFHARIAAEDPAAPFGFDDVAADVAAKLVHRHPHVYAEAAGPAGGGTSDSTGDVRADWERRKRVEKGRRTLFEGIPTSVPALLLATKMLDRLATSDLDVEPVRPAALPAAASPLDSRPDEVVGDVLLGVVAAARDAGVDPEQALRRALRRLRTDVAGAEAALQPAV